VKRAASLLVAAALAAGCASGEKPAPPPYDYGPFREHMPRSILVLPPLDDSREVDASYSFLSTITRPIAERGYYVFPVAVVAEFMKANGCPTPYEMHQAPLEKLAAAFGADAVLYLTIENWGTVYQIVNCRTSVAAKARLVDVRTGIEIWSAQATAQHDTISGALDGNTYDPRAIAVGVAVSAVVGQIATAFRDPSHELAPDVASGLVRDGHHGFPPGPRWTDDDEEREKTLRGRRVARTPAAGADADGDVAKKPE